MAKDIGRLTRHSPVKPQGTSTKGEYASDQLQITAQTVKPSKTSGHKAAMIDGPFGGGKKA